MKYQLLSKRYAQALFGLAVEMKILDKVEKDMRLIRDVMKENRELRIIMAHAVLDGYKKVRILDKIFDGKIENLTKKFLHLITKKGREVHLLVICEAFEDIFRDYMQIMEVTLTTAYHAEKKVTDAILAKLAKVTEKKLEVTEMVDESLIGGFRLEFEDYQYDDSVQVQLKRLGKEFSENLYISKL